MSYRGFDYEELITLVATGQAAACGRGEGLMGALNWVDANPRAIGEKPSDAVRQALIMALTPDLKKRLEEDAAGREQIAWESQYC